MSDEYYMLMADALLSLMIVEEMHNIYASKLFLLKEMYNVDKTIGLKTVKSTFELLLKLGFINQFENYKCSVKPEIHMIKSYKDLRYIDENNVTLNQLLRAEKLKQLKKKYETS